MGPSTTPSVRDNRPPEPGATPPAAPAAEQPGFFGRLRQAFSYATDPVGTTEQALRNAPDPAKFMMDNLANQREFRSGDGRRQLDTVRNDPQFMASLNNAIRRDPSVARGLAAASTGTGDSALSPASLISGLQDSQNRRTMGRVLDNIAESPDRDFTHLQRVAEAASRLNGRDGRTRENAQRMEQALGEVGVTDARLGLVGRSPMEMFRSFMDPQQRGAMLGQFLGPMLEAMPPQYRNMVAGLVGGLVGGAADFINPNGNGLGHYIRGFSAIAENARPGLEREGARILGAGAAPAAAEPLVPGRFAGQPAAPATPEARREHAAAAPQGTRIETSVQLASAWERAAPPPAVEGGIPGVTREAIITPEPRRAPAVGMPSLVG